MPLFDLPLDRLRTHRSAVAPPGDLAAFWAPSPEPVPTTSTSAWSRRTPA